MKVTLESTSKIVDVNNGVQARLWEGRTESGIEVHAFITRVAIDINAPIEHVEQFQRELVEQKAPRVALAEAYPARMFLP